MTEREMITAWITAYATLCGGPVGIVSAMYVHPWIMRRA
jgi:hypothetical protein